MSRVLERIQKPNDIKNISPGEYNRLAGEIREFLVEKVSRTGGHLASNLGVVELTMALHLAMDFPKDKLIFDVGHQSYVHKLLTGRAQGFETLRQFGGMSGFPKRCESNTDIFDTGHSSTSISEACGLVRARELNGGNEKIAAVIGDGAMTGGLAFEGLNNAGQLKSNLVIVLNDNKMSISENVGGMANYLAKLRTSNKYEAFKGGVSSTLKRIPVIGKGLARQLKKSKESLKQLMIPGMLFEEMNLTYIGPVDGHDVAKLKEVFQAAFRKNGAVVVHVLTKKGKGYECAEHDPSTFHGIGAFDIETGKSCREKNGPDYTDVFAEAMVDLAGRYRNLVAITAAMPSGTGLSLFRQRFPRRFFDVGIAEGHAVSFAAGLAAGGMQPVVAVYSTFLQRAYDQILHDVCINRLPVVFAVDRAGIVGNDGETHQGIFDLSYAAHIPNLTVMAPKNASELKKMLEYALAIKSPVLIRYPRGEACEDVKDSQEKLELGRCEWLEQDGEILLVAVGSMVQTAWDVAKRLEKQGIGAAVVNARFVAPLDEELLIRAKDYRAVVTLEENILRGGYGEAVAKRLLAGGYDGRFHAIGLPDSFIPQGNRETLCEIYGLDAASIAEWLVNWMENWL